MRRAVPTGCGSANLHGGSIGSQSLLPALWGEGGHPRFPHGGWPGVRLGRMRVSLSEDDGETLASPRPLGPTLDASFLVRWVRRPGRLMWAASYRFVEGDIKSEDAGRLDAAFRRSPNDPSQMLVDPRGPDARITLIAVPVRDEGRRRGSVT